MFERRLRGYRAMGYSVLDDASPLLAPVFGFEDPVSV